MAKKLSMLVTEPQAAFHALTCKFPAFVGGYGAGKTETMCNQAIIDASTSNKAIIGLYEPTYDLIRMILVPKLTAKLNEFGIEFEHNQTAGTIKTKSDQFGDFILKSLDSPDKLVGYETYCSHIDEIDTLPVKQAEEVWIKILGRNRQKLPNVKNQLNRICAYSTPEGFKFMYNRWVKNKIDGYELVKAWTESNPFLPSDYVESLRNSYPAELIEAYLHGEFVNLNSGSVYKSYNRVMHDSKEEILPQEHLFIGMDFNVTKMCASIYVRRNDGKHWHIVEEIKNVYDTPEMIKILKQRYEGHHIICYPDASGISRHSADASISDIALLQRAGFEIRAPRKNPLVKDRILAVNQAFSSGLLFVNQVNCPIVASCLEQQAYADNGEPDKKSGQDHQNDATGYTIAFEMPIRRPVLNIPVDYLRGK